MSLNPDLRDQAYQFFIEEAQELLQVLEDGLLDLRQDHSTNKVHELMRAAHSIKGGAASVELDAIKLLAHRLEDFFKALYSDSIEFDAELENLLLQGYDCLKNPLNQQMETGEYDAETALLTAEPVFAALEARLGDALKDTDNYIPSSNDLGVDIVSSIFEVDVVQSLDRLTEVARNPQNYELAGELRAQLEVFAGFAELFNLPGFTEIIQTAQTALDNNPDCALAIMEATIADCTLAKDAVLAGDRDRGGEVSEVLISLTQAQDGGKNVSSDLVNTSDTVPLDDVFGGFTDDRMWATVPTPEETVPESPALDDVFGSIPDSSQESTPEETTVESPALNDVFGSIPDSDRESTPEETTVESPALNDVFGSIPEVISEQQPLNTVDSNRDSQTQDTSLENLFETTPQLDVRSPNPAQNDNADISNQLNLDNSTSEEHDIETAARSIAEIFDSLPAVENIPPELAFSEAPTQPQTVTSKSKPKASDSKTKKKTAANLSVRVDLHRLERMNNLIGELTINRNSLALQNQHLQDNVRELLQKFSRFQQVTKQLREISDKMLVEQRSPNSHSSTPELLFTNKEAENQDLAALVSDRAADFDALEMDSYGVLYQALQEVLEEVVQLEEGVDDIAIFAKQSDRTIDTQRQMLGQMRDELMWVRMLPLEQILQRFPRTLRDLSHQYHKPVDLKLSGTGVLVDKAVLEKLYDPLLHLLRNGFDHGIETPEVRLQQGKPETGKIEINAYYQGNQTVIEIKDDGKGLDLNKITQKAIAQELISSQQLATATKEELFDLIFEPGFSTADRVSELSGRGVGMSVVRSQLESLKGKITVDSTPGKGSTFTLRLPLTLTIAKLLVCSLGSTAFAIPSDSIEEIIIPVAKQIKFSGSQKFLAWNQLLIPIYSLKQLLEYNCTMPYEGLNSKAFDTIATPDDWALPLLLLRRGQRFFVLEVESLISEQELVIKPFSKAITPPKYAYGCTILGDGTLIPAFDGSALIDEFLGEATTYTPSDFNAGIESETVAELSTATETIETKPESKLIGSTDSKFKTVQLYTLMVVDDSTAMRRTMALSLEKQGYRVIQAKDGKDALDKFRQNPNLNLIVCDIEMPTMNGFEFLGMRRRDSELSKIPVVMLTSRSGAKHRNLATQLGANGYFTKPYIEQEFLIEVKKILGQKPSLDHKSTGIPKKAANQKTILIIDDSSALRKTIALSLERKNYRVLQARDGVEGLELLKNNSQTMLVICDIEMPNMNGFEFLTARRKDSNINSIPVAMLTSRSSDKHRALAEKLGAKAYFTKPYVEEKFLVEIEKMINN